MTSCLQTASTTCAWRALPSVVLARTLSLLADDARDVVAAQLSCKTWLSCDKLQAVWKQCYMQKFEAESANDECIALDGDATTWSKRFARRATIEGNWQHGRALRRVIHSSEPCGLACLLEQRGLIALHTPRQLHFTA